METRPVYPLLLLTRLLSLWPGAEALSLYTINSVSLTPLPRAEVPSGTNVTLRCEVSVSHSSAEPLTHHFTFLRNDVQVYSKNSSEAVVPYFLSPARAAHSGTYECRVTVHDKSKGSSDHKLTVTGLQTPELNLSVVELFEGEEVTANCSAPNEAGSLAFYFYLDQEKVKTVWAMGTSAVTRIELKHAMTIQLYCTYNVVTVPDAGMSNHSNTVRVLVKGLFITPVMNVLPSKNLVEGDVVEFICKVIEPPVITEVFLTKEMRILKKGQTSLIHRFQVKPEDSGEYDCKAETRNIQKGTSENVVVKELFSKPVLIMEPREVFEGESFTLTCKVFQHASEGVRQNVKFFLYRDQRRLVASGGSYISTANPIHGNGNYSCSAQAMNQGQRSLISKNSTSFHLQAKVPVSIPILSVVGGRVVLGKPFQLQCQSAQGSLPVSYTLLGPLRQPEVQVVTGSRGPARFNVSSIQRASDISAFVCQARNNPQTQAKESVGGRLRHTTAIIEPVSKPVLEVSPEPGKASEGQDMTLTCSVQRGTPPITFTWFHTGKGKHLDFQTTNQLSGSITVQGLRQDHGGGYYCASVNPSNDTEWSATITVGVSLAGWKKGTMAAFCVIVILAIVFIILIKKGLPLFRRRKRAAELSVKPAGTKTDEEASELTMGLVNEAANITPGVMGRSVWSEHVSGSESDEPSSEEPAEIPETQYTEVHPPPADPNKAPVKPGTDTVYSEVQSSAQGASEQADGHGSLEYAQLNHDGDRNHDDYVEHCTVNHHGDHSDHSDPGDHGNHNDHSGHGNINGHSNHANHSNCDENGDYGDHGDCE